HDRSLTFDEYRSWCLGKCDEEGIERLVQEGRLSGNIPDLLARKQEYYLRYHGSQPKLYSGATALVHALAARGKQLYLVTASAAADVERILTDAGLDQVFPPNRRRVGVRSTERDTLYHDLVGAMELEPGQVAVVDDSPANLLLAQSLRL